MLLQTLRLLEGFDLRRMGVGSADALHTIVEAMKLAYADRDRYYGDPDFVQVPVAALLSDAYAAVASRADRSAGARASSSGRGIPTASRTESAVPTFPAIPDAA